MYGAAVFTPGEGLHGGQDLVHQGVQPDLRGEHAVLAHAAHARVRQPAGLEPPCNKTRG